MKEFKELAFFTVALTVFVAFMCYHFNSELTLPTKAASQNPLSIAAPSFVD